MKIIDQLIKEKLLKKENPDLEKSKRSIETALFFIEKAQQLLDLKVYDLSLIESYSAMFHAARALLFKDGFKERSHYAVCEYVKEVYKEKIPLRFINELNSLRLDRHDFFYDIEKRNEINEVESESAIQIAKEFLKIVESLLDKNVS